MKKLFRLLIMTIILIAGLVIISDTFGLFETEGIGVVKQDVGKWIIKINDVDITKSTNAEFVIDDFSYTENANVASGKIAPNSEGYVELVIDPSGTDVSVRYDLTLNLDVADTLSSLQINVEDLTGGEIIKTGDNKYTGVLKVDDIKNGKTNKLRINIKWLNDEANNDIDTEMGQNENSKVSIPITIRAIQYTGEEITAS